MKFRTLLMLVLLTPVSAQAKLDVFACVPEWGALAQALGGEKVDLYVATTAQQDPHYIQARPSLLAKVRRADLLVCNGADLEIGWLPVLLQRAGNRDIQPGRPGHFLAADHVELLDAPSRLDRSDGDIHPAGNPHIHLDPDRVLQVARALSARLQSLRPADAPHYQQRWLAFAARWVAATKRWKERALQLGDLPVVTGHTEWRYLSTWMPLQVVATLEAKPGIPPSSSHLAAVLQKTQQEKPLAVLSAPGRSTRGQEWLHKRSDIPVLALPYTVGGNAQASDLFGLFNSTLDALESLKR